MELCTYCGSASHIERDHVVPFSWNHIPQRKTYRKEEIVPACRECNGTLSDRLLFVIEARAAYLLGAYEKKYKKLLKWIDNWTEEEIAELGYSLQISVQKTRKDAEEVHRRLAYLRSVANRIPQDFGHEAAP